MKLGMSKTDVFIDMFVSICEVWVYVGMWECVYMSALCVCECFWLWVTISVY